MGRENVKRCENYMEKTRKADEKKKTMRERKSGEVGRREEDGGGGVKKNINIKI